MSTSPSTCYRHPDRETGLSCSECGRPICYECMTPAPVGLRCPEHSGKPQGIHKVTAAAERAVTGVGGQILGLIVLNLVFTFALSSFISVGAHIGGLIGGVVLMAALVQFRRSWQLSLASAGFVAVVAVFVAYNAI